MAGRVLSGTPASPGMSAGASWRRAQAGGGELRLAGEERERERDTALAALAQAAEMLNAVSSGLPAEEAEIVAAGVLMAQDPALLVAVEEAVLEEGLAAADAIVQATGEHADAIAALADETLAARADDVRSLGRRAARLSTDSESDAPPGNDLILVADSLGPADVAELAPVLAGVALVGGGATAHAAIVARSLGVPMVTGLQPQLLEIADGTALALNGTTGEVILEPSAAQVQAAAQQMNARRLAAHRAHARRDQPAQTRDGKRLTVLANVASAGELEIALRAGAEGIGLLRTELAFLDASSWPDEQAHTGALRPILAGLGGRRAVVRVLDFGADKSPPMLRGVEARGVELLLAHSDAFIAQLRAILLAGHGRDVRILLPMVDRSEQLAASRALLEQAARQLGVATPPPLGSMIETRRAAENADALAEGSAFLSIGTNDLTAATLRTNRFTANAARAHDPRVLRSIERSVTAAHAAGIAIEVCGEAASDPLMLPLLVGLGVDELSVGASRVGAVRGWIRDLSAAEARRIALSCLGLDTAEQVELAVRPLASELQSGELGTGAWAAGATPCDSAQSGNGSRQRIERGGGIGALGA